MPLPRTEEWQRYDPPSTLRTQRGVDAGALYRDETARRDGHSHAASRARLAPSPPPGHPKRQQQLHPGLTKSRQVETLVHKMSVLQSGFASGYRKACPRALSHSDGRAGQTRGPSHPPNWAPRQLLQVRRIHRALFPPIHRSTVTDIFHPRPQLGVVMNLTVTRRAVPTTPVPGVESPSRPVAHQSWNRDRRGQTTQVRTIHRNVNASNGRDRPPPMLTRSIQFKTALRRPIKRQFDLTGDTLPKGCGALCNIDHQTLGGAPQRTGTNIEPICSLLQSPGTALCHTPTGLFGSVENHIETDVIGRRGVP